MSGARRRLVTVVGARPQFVKAAAVSHELRRRGDIEELLVHTGQHYDGNMSDVFFDELDIPAPDRHLGIGGGTHGAMTGRMLEAVEGVLLDTAPDAVLVYGDTNSTMAGALAAVKLHIPVAHVEAGLRSFNRRMPEETNRVVTDHVATWLFAPTATAVENLRREGIAGSQVVRVGDVMYDAALVFGARADARSTAVRDLGLAREEFVLATVHRAENTDDGTRLRAIIDGLRVVAGELPVVLPVHPRTADAMRKASIDAESAGLRLVPPVGYLDMLALERAARLIVTDSGGVQKEAFFYEIPCVTLREETEWVELVELGWNRLVPPTSVDAVVDGHRSALHDPPPVTSASP
jgi:UDP-GlcNAc3NAcA epimerase